MVKIAKKEKFQWCSGSKLKRWDKEKDINVSQETVFQIQRSITVFTQLLSFWPLDPTVDSSAICLMHGWTSHYRACEDLVTERADPSVPLLGCGFMWPKDPARELIAESNVSCREVSLHVSGVS